MRFADNNFNMYRAETKSALAHELYRSSFARVHATDVYDWCTKCSDRIYEQYNYRMEFTDLESFIDELIKHNLILEIQ